jgi:hypothetical protein
MGRSFSPACDLQSHHENGIVCLVWSLFHIVDGFPTQVYSDAAPLVLPSFAVARIFTGKCV